MKRILFILTIAAYGLVPINFSSVHAQSISAGTFHSLAICNDSTVSAWGLNQWGELGIDLLNYESNIPVKVNALNQVIAVAAGRNHSLALKNDGTVWAWGDNAIGELGQGTLTVGSTVPVQVKGLTNIKAITAGGYYFSLALKNDGTVWAWGNNNYGQLGNGTYTNSNKPIQVIGLLDVVAISEGNAHCLALKKDGTVWAWGYNMFGQLGIGGQINSSIPIQVSSLTGVVAVSAGRDHSLALTVNGTVLGWGINTYGQLGDPNTYIAHLIPVLINGLSGIIAIAGGEQHSLALKSDGTVWAWGSNLQGQLGNGNNIDSSIPSQVTNLSGVKAITSSLVGCNGGGHCQAITDNGELWTWGHNFHGQLGVGNNTNSNVPVQVSDVCSLLNGVNTITEQSDIFVYPNPFASQTTLEANDLFKDATLTINNCLSQTVKQMKNISGEEIILFRDNLPGGLYFIHLREGNKIHTCKLVITE